MRVLVTGGNRYIGRDLVFVLAELGHEVTVINSHESPLPEGAKRIHPNRREPGAFETALADHFDDFDAVFDNTAYTPAHVQPNDRPVPWPRAALCVYQRTGGLSTGVPVAASHRCCLQAAFANSFDEFWRAAGRCLDIASAAAAKPSAGDEPRRHRFG